MVDRVVNNQEAVVECLGFVNRYRRVLCVVLCQVQLQLFGYIPGVNLCANCCPSFRKQQQNSFVDEVVK
jgi:hypothetical protein